MNRPVVTWLGSLLVSVLLITLLSVIPLLHNQQDHPFDLAVFQSTTGGFVGHPVDVIGDQPFSLLINQARFDQQMLFLELTRPENVSTETMDHQCFQLIKRNLKQQQEVRLYVHAEQDSFFLIAKRAELKEDPQTGMPIRDYFQRHFTFTHMGSSSQP